MTMENWPFEDLYLLLRLGWPVDQKCKVLRPRGILWHLKLCPNRGRSMLLSSFWMGVILSSCKVYNRSVHRRIRHFVKFSSVMILNEPGYHPIPSGGFSWLRCVWDPNGFHRRATHPIPMCYCDSCWQQTCAMLAKGRCQGIWNGSTISTWRGHLFWRVRVEEYSAILYYFIKSRMVGIASSYW